MNGILAKFAVAAFFWTAVSSTVVSTPGSGDKAEPKTIRETVNMVIKAYGGREAITKAAGVYARGTNRALMRDDSGTYERYLSRADRRLRVDITYSGSSETRILNGHRGWRGIDGESPVEVTDLNYLAMVYQYKQLDLPYGILARAYRISDFGMDEVGGRAVRVFRLDDNEGPPIAVYIDVNTGMVLKTSGYFAAHGQASELSAEFSDFRKVSGVMMPHVIVNYASGVKIGETVIESYEVNPPMKNKLFKP